ncbi:MAG: nucleotidyltransferase [Caulobacteraceae bacterium]
MKTVGIISEYNPFHNGHKYHIHTAKKVCGADYAVCIMSGSFVQRGEPAIMDKWSRARMAVTNGADLVIELPFAYACQPAEIFALGAVKILNGLGVVDYLCFGSELGDTETLSELAKLLHQEPEGFKLLLKDYLGQGISYPKAISTALFSYLGGSEQGYSEEILKNPNNVLGIEYIKALLLLNSDIKPVAVKRMSSGYNDTAINSSIASATAVRNEILENGLSESVRSAVPHDVYNILKSSIETGRNPISLDSFSDIILYKLRTMELDEFEDYLNIREGIEYRLKKFASSCSTCEELLEAVKTKRYTRTYIQRLLCQLMIGIKRSDIAGFKNIHSPAYIRVLAFNGNGKLLLKSIKENSFYPLVTKAADFCSDNAVLNRMFHFDTLSTDIYNLGYKEYPFRKASADYLTSPYYHRE